MTTAYRQNQSPRLPSNYTEHLERIEREAQRQREENEWKQEVFVSALIGVGMMVVIISTWVLTK